MQPILDYFRHIVATAPSPTVIELGAHNGYHTRLLAEVLRDGGKPYRMYALEPDQRQHAPLIEAVAKYDGVQIIPAAIASTDTECCTFNLSDGVQEREGSGKGQKFDGSSSIRPPTQLNKQVFPEMHFRPALVRAMSLDSFAWRYSLAPLRPDHGRDDRPIDFIWADIQGAEVDLIHGGRVALAHTRYLYTEYCNSELYKGEIGLAGILAALPDFEVVADYGGDVLLRNRKLNPRPLLSVCICTIDSREKLMARLADVLRPQIEAAFERVELLIDRDNGDVSIGARRQRMLDRACGRYVAFIDDDDLVHPQYVSFILKAIDDTDADCVGFKLRRFVDDDQRGHAIHSMRFSEWGEQRSGGDITFERTPNHLNPVRLELAREVGFQSINWGEDRDYSARLRPLLKSESFVDEFLYDYFWRNPKRNRHGEITHASRNGE